MGDNKPLYPIKADPTTLDGIKLTLGKGSIEGEDNNQQLVLNHTAIEFNSFVNNVWIESGMNASKLEIMNATDKNRFVAESLKVSNLANSEYLECKKDGLVILDATGQSNLTVDDLVFTSGGINTLTLDDSQLLSNINNFTVENASTYGTITLKATTIDLKGLLKMEGVLNLGDKLNFSSANTSTGAGLSIAKYLEVSVGGQPYKIALLEDS